MVELDRQPPVTPLSAMAVAGGAKSLDVPTLVLFAITAALLWTAVERAWQAARLVTSGQRRWVTLDHPMLGIAAVPEKIGALRAIS